MNSPTRFARRGINLKMYNKIAAFLENIFFVAFIYFCVSNTKQKQFILFRSCEHCPGLNPTNKKFTEFGSNFWFFIYFFFFRKSLRHLAQSIAEVGDITPQQKRFYTTSKKISGIRIQFFFWKIQGRYIWPKPDYRINKRERERESSSYCGAPQ